MTRFDNFTITDGTDQQSRAPVAFRAGYFNVDEMSFETLLAIASRYASTIRYYDSDNRPEGAWGELFHSNEAVVLALIATCDERRIEVDFLQLNRSGLIDAAEYVVQIAAQLDFWLQRLASATTPAVIQLRRHLQEMITTRLLPGFHTAAAIMLREREQGEAAYNLESFSTVWAIQNAGEEFRLNHADEGAVHDRAAAFSALEEALLRIVAAVRNLKLLVEDALQASLRSQSHEPAVGLYMVFLHLYRVAQSRLNRFTMRHLDFYYREVLKGVPQKRQEESLFLVFKPAAKTTELLIDRDAPFSAAKQRSAEERYYRLKEPLMVRAAKVRELRTLYFQRSPLISPECELGYVTRIKSRRRIVDTTGGDEVVESIPLFGGERSGVRQPGSRDAEIGFAIASPVLELNEGRREVVLLIDFTLPGMESISEEFTRDHHFGSPAEFAAWFGKIFSYYLLSGEAFLDETRRTKLLSLAARYGDSGAAYRTLLTDPWQDVFYRLFKRPFAISLSGANGWLPVNEYLVAPAIEDDSGVNSGLKVVLSLGHNVESIVACDGELHGEHAVSNLPMLNLSLNPEASFVAYSLLNSVDVRSVEVEVSVKGVRDLAISNQLGRIDPAKPFAPFGPLPSRNSFVVVGSREAAKKEVTEISLSLGWGELPIASGGFTTHYQGYQTIPFNSSFKVEISVLQDGNWMPRRSEVQYRAPLFESGRNGVVSERSRLEVGAVDHLKPLESDERFEYHGASRNGFVRLQLASPDNAFGHGDYPRLLTQILTENARRKKAAPVPNPPYTPMLKEVSLNYRARCRVTPGIDSSTERGPQRERLFHRHPFGIEPRYPVTGRGRMALFPRYREDGNLFIGIETAQLAGYLSLFFDLDEEAAHSRRSVPPLLQWRCLTREGWQLLERRRVLSDSTERFVRSGIVTLDLPQGMVSDSPMMPAGQFWLWLAADGELHSFSGLRGVVANAGEISSTQKAAADDTEKRVRDAESWRSVNALPGLDMVTRIGGRHGGRSAESDAAFRTRFSERLHHKGRASTPWDYERLILARFPEIYKVKCFPNTVSGRSTPAPGNVLIVVVPHMQRDGDRVCERGMINPAELSRIRHYVQQLASPFVKIEVRNPAYEQIQVRCSVKFSGDLSGSGLYIKRLNRAISDYLSPWCDIGYGARFGWAIRSDDIESYIRELDYVEFVTNFSMLHIVEQQEGRYLLMDTAELDSRHETLITPRYPWSLALPMRRHFIETTATVEAIAAQVTGVSELEIGSTFIIGGN